MKKFYSFLFAAVALVGFAACNSDSTEEPAPAQQVGKMEFTANIGEDTKTSLDGMSVKWCKEDTIWVNFKEFQIKDKASYEAATSATFTGNPVEAPFVAVYPYNKDVAFNTETSVFATLKANVGEGTFADGANIAVAYSKEGTNLSFKNVLSVLKFQVAAACETVTISSTSALVGKVAYKATDGTIADVATTDADKEITLTIDGGFKAGVDYYTTVIPGTHELTITTNTKTTKPSKTIVKNKIYNLGILNVDVYAYLRVTNPWKQGNERFAAYFWGTDGNQWVDMVATDNYGVYSCVVPAGKTGVTFCRMNGSNKTNGWDAKWDQTDDLTAPTNNVNNLYTIYTSAEGKATGGWSDYEYNYPEKLYLTPDNNWKSDGARFAIYLFGNGDKWISMTKIGETDTYEVTLPTDTKYTNVIFCRMNPNAADNNWGNKWNQTQDEIIPINGNNMVTINGWDNYSWSTK